MYEEKAGIQGRDRMLHCLIKNQALKLVLKKKLSTELSGKCRPAKAGFNAKRKCPLHYRARDGGRGIGERTGLSEGFCVKDVQDPILVRRTLDKNTFTHGGRRRDSKSGRSRQGSGE